MRKTKTFQIEGYDKQFVVNEISVRQIFSLFDQEKTVSFLSLLDEQFLPMAGNITYEEIQDMVPSEIEIVWQKFKEVNSSFFGLARVKGVDQLIQKIQESFVTDSLALFASLSKPGI